MTAVRISDAGMEQITPSGPNQTGSSERQPPKKQSGGTVKPVPPLIFFRWFSLTNLNLHTASQSYIKIASKISAIK